MDQGLKMSEQDIVAVWGTFDLLHEGHIQFLKNAARYGKLNVIVIPDNQVITNKGYLPDNNEHERMENLKKLSFVESVYIDCIEMGLDSIEKINPNCFCLGYDQDNFWENILKKFLSSKNIQLDYKTLDRYADGIHSRYLRKGRNA